MHIGRDIMHLYYKVATSRMTAANHKIQLQMNSHEIYHGATFGYVIVVLPFRPKQNGKIKQSDGIS